MVSIEISWLLENAPYGLIFLLLLAAGLGLPMPEDVVLLASGALIHRGAIELVPTAAVCTTGVIAGDLAKLVGASLAVPAGWSVVEKLRGV